MPLIKQRRQQLDGIVRQMVTNKETDADIQFVVNDFTSKYGAEAQAPGLLKRAENVLTGIFPGKQIGEAIGTQIAKATVPKEQRGFISPGPSARQVTGDVASAALMIGTPLIPGAGTALGRIAQFGAVGGLGAGASALSRGEEIENIPEETIKGAAIGASAGALFGAIEKGVKMFGNLLGATGRKIQTAIIKPTQADIKDGFSIDTINKYNLGGSLKKTFEKTDKVLDDLSLELNQKLAQNPTKLNLNEVYNRTAKRLLGNKLESFGANAQLDGAIEKLKNEILTVSGKSGKLSIPESQLIKRAAGHFGAWSFGVPTPEATASQKVYNTFYNELKTAIEKASPEGIKNLNQEISKLIPVMNALIRRIPVAERNNVFSLTDIITATGAVLDPRSLGLTALNLASKSGTIGASLAKTPELTKKISLTGPITRTATLLPLRAVKKGENKEK